MALCASNIIMGVPTLRSKQPCSHLSAPNTEEQGRWLQGLQERVLGMHPAPRGLALAGDWPWSAQTLGWPHSPCSSVDQHCLPPTAYKEGQGFETGFSRKKNKTKQNIKGTEKSLRNPKKKKRKEEERKEIQIKAYFNITENFDGSP